MFVANESKVLRKFMIAVQHLRLKAVCINSFEYVPWDDTLRCGCLFVVKSLILSDTATRCHASTQNHLSYFDILTFWSRTFLRVGKSSDKFSLLDWLIRKTHIILTTQSINYNFKRIFRFIQIHFSLEGDLSSETHLCSCESLVSGSSSHCKHFFL